uniref:ribonuclease H n=1 Tax=Salmo trutta TaxID=8032 RepID=A0A674F3Q9_SALTR
MTTCHMTSSSAWRSGWTISCGPDQDLCGIRSPWLHLRRGQNRWRWAVHVCPRRRNLGLCSYCGEKGNFSPTCPLSTNRRGGDNPGNSPAPTQEGCKISSPFLSTQPVCFPIKFLEYHSPSLPLALIDQSSSYPFGVRASDNRPIGAGLVHHITVPVSLLTHDTHLEQITFLIIDTPMHPVDLDLPWLSWHNPVISWSERRLLGWLQECQGRCLAVSVNTTTVESPDHAPQVDLPEEYQDLGLRVFSKIQATRMPLPHPWDCAIDLLSDAALPRGHVYPLSYAETEAMEIYVRESLQQGFICPSTSPAPSSFFFVKKKDGGLLHCIDYRTLNNATIKFSYPFPRIPTLVKQMHRAQYFMKLDLRSAYNLVRIRAGDEWKTAFSTTFGLSNTPSVFQAFINEEFRDMLG